MQIIILCGGLGTRLKSVSQDQPKGLLKINGKVFLQYFLESIIPFNFSSLHFCLGYGSEKYLTFLEKNNLNFEYTFSIEQENDLLGTGGAVKNALPFLKENFVLQYGDTILNIDYNKLYNQHLMSKKVMTMSILPSNLSSEAPNIFCDSDVNGNLQCVYNKKNPPNHSNFIDYGALVFKKTIFENFKGRSFDLSEIQQALTLKKKACFFKVKNSYIEIGNPTSYKNAFNSLN